jgi:hypothetical protein
LKVSEAQYRRISSDAEAKGHKTVSGYIREVVLGWELPVQEKIYQIFEAVVEKKSGPPRPRADRSLREYLDF